MVGKLGNKKRLLEGLNSHTAHADELAHADHTDSYKLEGGPEDLVVKREVFMDEDAKEELVRSRFLDQYEDLIDGETFFDELESGKYD